MPFIYFKIKNKIKNFVSKYEKKKKLKVLMTFTIVTFLCFFSKK